jgi:hypothetical protein
MFTDFNDHHNIYFECKKCDFICSKKSDWSRHIKSKKHEKFTNVDVFTPNTVTNYAKNIILRQCICGKEFNSRQSLYMHKKRNNCCVNVCNKMENENIHLYDKDLIKILIKENAEFKKMFFEQNKLVMNLIEKNNSNIQPSINTINNNCNNKTFNLQVFLNETCKDAMNISDFIENISLQLSDLESIGRLGYVEGVSNIIIKNLNALDIDKRPLHCTDKKRETVYIKDDDEWQKEEEDKKRIKSVISGVVSKNLQLLSEYEDKYPECMNPESKKSDEYNKIIMETMGGGVNAGEKNREKIIRKIVKEVVIDKE